MIIKETTKKDMVKIYIVWNDLMVLMILLIILLKLIKIEIEIET